MSDDGANEALLLRAWKARNSLYEDLFGPHLYALPKHYTPPAGSTGNLRAPAKQEEPSIKNTKKGDVTDCNTDTSIEQVTQRLMESQAMKGADMNQIRELVESLFTPQLCNQRISVLAYEPTDKRPYWLYVTAGLSNPWYQEEASEVSGFGCELMVKSKSNSRWPFRLLRRLAYYIMSYSGTLSPGVFLSMEEPIGASKTARADLNNLFVWYADEAPDCWYQLPSGGFGVFCVVGITDDECRFAESVNDYGAWCIQQVLRQTYIGQVTDPRRESVMAQENIGGILSSVRMYAENFRPATL